jgi:feruloyl-CoA synthase
MFGELISTVTHRDTGEIIVENCQQPGLEPVSLTERLHHYAKTTPETVFIAEGQGASVTYAEMLKNVLAVAGWLLKQNLSNDRPVVILSGNDILHATLALACLEIGVPFCPVSVPYSLASSDLSKIKYVYELLTPGLVFASDAVAFSRALGLVTCQTLDGEGLKALYSHASAKAVKVTGKSIAKFLLTSGSTGLPKAVVNTHEMLSVNQMMLIEYFAFCKDEPPVIVDWLPWNHTFGGNHNFNLVLFNGGTLYIDDGKPMPGLIDKTLDNLRKLPAPTIYFNVPKGFDMLLAALEKDEALAAHFFSRLRFICYAGAALSQPTWDGLKALSKRMTGVEIVMGTALGSTETSPAALQGNIDADKSGVVGKPLPGVTLKLVPNAGKMELRIKGKNIMPGYWRKPELTEKAFDEEGFYMIGDAVKPVIEGDYASGFVFDGRIAEDFKLASGTWVSVGPLRAALMTALAPYARDSVIAGHNRDEITAIIIPAGAVDEADLALKLKAYNAGGSGGATRVKRITVLTDALSIDVGEVTDKGSINQRALLEHRHSLVTDLYANPSPSHIIKG